MTQQRAASPAIDFDEPRLKRHRTIRGWKDKIAKVTIGAGGFSVIVAITLIFFYLLYEVIPLFKPASIEQVAAYEVPALEAGETVLLAMEEQAQKALRVTRQGRAVFFDTRSGAVESNIELPIPSGVTISSIAEAGVGGRLLAAGLSNGGVLLFEQEYQVSYPDNIRVITPTITYPYGEEIILVNTTGTPVTRVAVSDNDSGLFLVAVDRDSRMFSKVFEKTQNFLTGESTLKAAEVKMPALTDRVTDVEIDPESRWLYIANDHGKLDMFDLRDRTSPVLNSRVTVATGGARIADMEFLLGGISLVIADTDGNLSQWFPVRDHKNEYTLQKIRSFEHEGGGIQQLVAEHRRKGFMTVGHNGKVALYNSTANRRVLDERITTAGFQDSAIAPRGNYAMFETVDGRVAFWAVDNEHPEVSWSSLWGKVWYEGYDEPKYVWQSSSANDDFEPKYSLSPLAFGTLKAAFYAMLLATPIAIAGAIYTAYFMAPAVRRKVKPAIELMEALPTVILGFLAGLFFAPYMEAHLPGVFACLLLVPLAILLFAFAWANLPDRIRHSFADGWESLMLVPVILFAGWLAFELSDHMEIWFFGGDVRLWIREELGLGFDQRNALVIGVAMGFAIIPVVFSITEDAVFSVPKHLSYGSLALGATPWQTLTRVILPTASPGIFSAVMIGMGRAVGETMIVLMATGNKPVMDLNMFEGMRTLSANIAVEMPESAVGSTHFRILFLAAFVLFLFTFVVNTIAEYVRQRLRKKYMVI